MTSAPLLLLFLHPNPQLTSLKVLGRVWSFILAIGAQTIRVFTSSFGSGLNYIYLIHVIRFCVTGIVSICSKWVKLVIMVGPPSPSFTWGTFPRTSVSSCWGRKLGHCAASPCHHLLEKPVFYVLRRERGSMARKQWILLCGLCSKCISL